MPCRDEWSSDAGFGGTRENPVNIEMKKRLDEATRLLCALCTRLDNKEGHLFPHSKAIPGLSQWWKRHQEEDRKAEAKRREAKKAREIAKIRRIAELEAELHKLRRGE